MRLSSMHYLLREGLRGIWQNRFMAVAAVGVLVSCLLLTGAAYLAVDNIDHAFEWVYEQNVVVVYMQEDVAAADLPNVSKTIEGIANVEKVDLLTKDEQLERMKGSLPEEVYAATQGKNNPLLDAFVVTMRDMEQFDATVAQLQKIARVDEVVAHPELAQTLTHARQMVLTAGSWMIGILLLVSVFIISNTIRLTVHARRLEIFIMKSVGATNRFVRLPFLVEGTVLGLVSGGLAYGVLILLYSQLISHVKGGVFLGVGVVPPSEVNFVLLWGCLLVGLCVGALGGGISIRRYLKEDSMADLQG